MSLSLALAAQRGKYGTICCDGRLIFGDQTTADVYAPKFQSFGEWIFMLAGELASADCTLEELRVAALDPKNAGLFTRDKITDTLLWAFNRRLERWKFIRHLSGFGLKNMREFTMGRARFGTKLYDELVAHMHQDARVNFHDQVMVVGWGKAESSLTIYSVSLNGDKSHMKDGHGAIGSGTDRAIETLLKLNHGINATLQDAIYATLAAKFSAEGKKVGPDTYMWVLRNPHSAVSGNNRIPIHPDQVAQFRAIWNRYRHLRGIPYEARELAASIVEQTNDEEVINENSLERIKAHISLALRTMQSTSRKSKRAR